MLDFVPSMLVEISGAQILAAMILSHVAIGIFMWAVWKKQDLDLPIVGEPGQADLRAAMEEGTRKYPDSAFILPLRDPTVILPLAWIDQFKSLPDTQSSLNANNYRRFFGRYTLMGHDSPEFVASIKLDLTRNLGSLLPEMAEETQYALDQGIGPCNDWTTVPVYPSMLNIITLVSGRVFVGLPLSREQAWIDSSIRYAMDSVAASDRIRNYPPLLQPLIAPFLSETRSVLAHQARVRSMLQPFFTANHPSQVNTVPLSKIRSRAETSPSTQGRLLHWLRSHYSDPAAATSQNLGKDHLLAFFAAIHIATNALTQVILELAAHPEYADKLRAELAREMPAREPGAWTTAALARLTEMDAFMKEALRANPPGGIVALMRYTTSPLPLPNGPTLPKGTFIAFPNTLFDHSRPTKKSSFSSISPLVSAAPDALTFGYGSHVCPGRAFATAELKIALALVLWQWDVRLKPGEKRPANVARDFQIMPAMGAGVEMRRRLGVQAGGVDSVHVVGLSNGNMKKDTKKENIVEKS